MSTTTATPPGATTEPLTEDPRASEAALVQRFLAETKAPPWLERAFRTWEDHRRYLHTEVMAEDDHRKISCNSIYRSLRAKMAHTRPNSPEPSVKPAEQIEPDPDDPLAPLYQQQKKQLEQIGRTAAVLNKKWSARAKLGDVLVGAQLEAHTTGICWLKTGWEEDESKNALGQAVRHAGTSMDQLRRLRRLADDYAAGEFTDDDARFEQLLDLSNWLKARAKAALQRLVAGDPREDRMRNLASAPDGQPMAPYLLPEPESWQGPTVDFVAPENLRLDWQRVTGPHLLHRGRWWMERVWMTREEVAERYHLTPDDARRLGSPVRRAPNYSDPTMSYLNTNAQDPADTDLEAQVRSGGAEVAVWERWDLETGWVYWVCQGLERFLAKELVETSTKRGHPYAPLIYNPVAGRFTPLSDVGLGRKMQDNFNQTLTDDWEARVASYPFYAVLQGLLTEEDKEAIEQGRQAHKVVELSRSAQEVKDAIQRIAGEEYHPERYQIALAKTQGLLDQMVGAPSETSGGTSRPEFATQSAMQQQGLNVSMADVRAINTELTRQVFEDWTDYALAVLPERNAKALAGMAAVWPAVDRDTIANGLVVEVVTAGDRGQAEQELEQMGKAMGVVAQALQLEQVAALAGYQFPATEVATRAALAVDLRLPGGLLRRGMPGALPPGVQQALAGLLPGGAAGGASSPMPGGMPAAGGVPQQLRPAMAG